jgi:hypothetical protein
VHARAAQDAAREGGRLPVAALGGLLVLSLDDRAQGGDGGELVPADAPVPGH